MGKILLFHVNIFKVNQIAAVCETVGLEMISVPVKDYGKSLGSLAGIEGIKSNTIYDGQDFSDEMLVFSGVDSSTLDRFLDEYKKAKVAPIKRKAVITPSNVRWSATKLYTELSDHI